MSCLFKYRWVKLPRACLPLGKGLLGLWARLAARAAFRKGIASYCGHRNPVIPGMWSGGIVGLKSILGIKRRETALDTLARLSDYGFLQYQINAETKHLVYQLCDWIVECSGDERIPGNVYTTEGYGFLCVPRSLTDRLVDRNYIFEDSDAWLDLWCHTVSMDPRNAFSFYAPVCQYGKYGVFLTLETLGQRWGWEKTKVWRFLQKHEDATRAYAEDRKRHGSLREHMSRMVVYYSRQYLLSVDLLSPSIRQNTRVALSSSLYRAYISLCWNWKNGSYDCGSCDCKTCAESDATPIRGPCPAVDLSDIAKEFFTNG